VKNILFDLDGTLTDPLEGITKCLRYSLECLGEPCPPDNELASYIGPPLRHTFAAICTSTDSAYLDNAVALYRERYSTVGLYESKVHVGVREMLVELRSSSYNMFVATSKPEVYAKRILRYFSLDSFFAGVYGNDLSGRLDNKVDLVSELITQYRLVKPETIIVGDRKYDVVAGRMNGISSLGVTYGYGSREELESAGVDFLCASPLEIITCIENRFRAPNKTHV
jgi:phosphoglycolate phosphatase